MAAADITIAVAQLNPIVGDIAGNAGQVTQAYSKAVAQGAKLVVFPEMMLVGYPPEDVVLTPDFRKCAMRAASELAALTKNSAAMLLGSVWEQDGQIHNAAIFCKDGHIEQVYAKTMLPNEGVFDEKRLFTAGTGAGSIEVDGITIGLLVCEDVWHQRMIDDLVKIKPQLVVVMNASPFEAGKLQLRQELVAQAAQQIGASFVYVNMTGGQDDIVFDGGSFVAAPDGTLPVQLPEFRESVFMLRCGNGFAAPQWACDAHAAPMQLEESLWQAMQLGLRDYVRKNGFSTVMLGLSGGIDSALTAALAVDALGNDNVKGVLLSSPYTSHESVEDAEASAQMLGIQTLHVPITASMSIMEEVLSPIFMESGWMTNPVVGGNLQSRLRGVSMMAVSNQFGWMLLSTGNKSEVAVGYSTLYGDSCGGYNVLKDLYKTQVYALAHWRNAKGQVIPLRSITKAPTAELAPGQKDEDQLPPYAVLDQILHMHIEEREPPEVIAARGFDRAVVDKVLRLVRLNEYKRRQSCPGVKLSSMLFGKDRRFPITCKY